MTMDSNRGGESTELSRNGGKSDYPPFGSNQKSGGRREPRRISTERHQFVHSPELILHEDAEGGGKQEDVDRLARMEERFQELMLDISHLESRLESVKWNR